MLAYGGCRFTGIRWIILPSFLPGQWLDVIKGRHSAWCQDQIVVNLFGKVYLTKDWRCSWDVHLCSQNQDQYQGWAQRAALLHPAVLIPCHVLEHQRAYSYWGPGGCSAFLRSAALPCSMVFQWSALQHSASWVRTTLPSSSRNALVLFLAKKDNFWSLNCSVLSRATWESVRVHARFSDPHTWGFCRINCGPHLVLFSTKNQRHADPGAGLHLLFEACICGLMCGSLCIVSSGHPDSLLKLIFRVFWQYRGFQPFVHSWLFRQKVESFVTDAIENSLKFIHSSWQVTVWSSVSIAKIIMLTHDWCCSVVAGSTWKLLLLSQNLLQPYVM